MAHPDNNGNNARTFARSKPPCGDETPHIRWVESADTSSNPGERMAEGEGSRRLVIAILGDALNCYQRFILASKGRGRRLFLEAEQWLLEHDTVATISFQHVCDHLGVEADRLRKQLRRWRDQRLSASGSSRTLRVLIPHRRRSPARGGDPPLWHQTEDAGGKVARKKREADRCASISPERRRRSRYS